MWDAVTVGYCDKVGNIEAVALRQAVSVVTEVLLDAVLDDELVKDADAVRV